MKRYVLLTAIFALFALSAAAQDKAAAKVPVFAGTWVLDLGRSDLGGDSTIEGQTMTVTQTAATLKVETTTKRTPVETVTPGGMQAGGRGRPMGVGTDSGRRPGDKPVTYTLGKETQGETEGFMGPMPITLSAKFEGEKLNLSSTRTWPGPSGDVTTTNREIWELWPDGKSLTVTSERTSMMAGTQSSVKIFRKKP